MKKIIVLVVLASIVCAIGVYSSSPPSPYVVKSGDAIFIRMADSLGVVVDTAGGTVDTIWITVRGGKPDTTDPDFQTYVATHAVTGGSGVSESVLGDSLTNYFDTAAVTQEVLGHIHRLYDTTQTYLVSGSVVVSDSTAARAGDVDTTGIDISTALADRATEAAIGDTATALRGEMGTTTTNADTLGSDTTGGGYAVMDGPRLTGPSSIAVDTIVGSDPSSRTHIDSLVANLLVLVFGADSIAVPDSIGAVGTYLKSDGTDLVWDTPSGAGDITGVTAGVGLTGGGMTGDVTLDVDTTTVVASKNFVRDSAITPASGAFTEDGSRVYWDADSSAFVVYDSSDATVVTPGLNTKLMIGRSGLAETDSLLINEFVRFAVGVSTVELGGELVDSMVSQRGVYAAGGGVVVQDSIAATVLDSAITKPKLAMAVWDSIDIIAEDTALHHIHRLYDTTLTYLVSGDVVVSDSTAAAAIWADTAGYATGGAWTWVAADSLTGYFDTAQVVDTIQNIVGRWVDTTRTIIYSGDFTVSDSTAGDVDTTGIDISTALGNRASTGALIDTAAAIRSDIVDSIPNVAVSDSVPPIVSDTADVVRAEIKEVTTDLLGRLSWFSNDYGHRTMGDSTYLKVPVHGHWADSSLKGGAWDVTHADVMKCDSSVFGYNYVMAYTPHPTSEYEDVCVVFSNDGINWDLRVNGVGDTVAWPLLDNDAVFWKINPADSALGCWSAMLASEKAQYPVLAPGYTADADLTIINDTIWVFGMGGPGFTYADSCTPTEWVAESAIWASYTADGINWVAARDTIVHGAPRGTGGWYRDSVGQMPILPIEPGQLRPMQLLSPCIEYIPEKDSVYIYVVDRIATDNGWAAATAGPPGADTALNLLVRWAAHRPWNVANNTGATWVCDTIDIVPFANPNQSNATGARNLMDSVMAGLITVPGIHTTAIGDRRLDNGLWHMGLTRTPAGDLVLVGNNDGYRKSAWAWISYDTGNTFEPISYDPIAVGTGDTAWWDMYRPVILFEDDGRAVLYMSTNGNSSWQNPGEDFVWRLEPGPLGITNSIADQLVRTTPRWQQKSVVLMPDILGSDTVALFSIDEDLYPRGATLRKAKMQLTDSVEAATLQFFEGWNGPDSLKWGSNQSLTITIDSAMQVSKTMTTSLNAGEWIGIRWYTEPAQTAVIEFFLEAK